MRAVHCSAEAEMLMHCPSATRETSQSMFGCIGASLPCCVHWLSNAPVPLLPPQQSTEQSCPQEKDFALIFRVRFVLFFCSLPFFVYAHVHTHTPSSLSGAFVHHKLVICLFLQYWGKLCSTSGCFRAWTQAATLIS